MQEIFNFIDTHTAYGLLGALCFVGVLCAVLMAWLSGRTVRLVVAAAASLPALLSILAVQSHLRGIAAALNGRNEADIINPVAALQVCSELLWLGFGSSLLLVGLILVRSRFAAGSRPKT